MPCTTLPAFTDAEHLANWNQRFSELDAQGRVRCALEHLPGTHVLTSSFGAQAAVSLHLLNEAQPGIPVVLLDTGYLFPETYEFIDQLTRRFDLNLRVYRSLMSPAWQEARFGQRIDQVADQVLPVLAQSEVLTTEGDDATTGVTPGHLDDPIRV